MKWFKQNLIVVLMSMLIFGATSSRADTQFRIIVDASGSMLMSDPDKLTSEALRLISNLAPEEHATLGIWLFGETPRVLLPEDRINKATKAKLSQYVDSYATEDLKTDLEAIIALLLNTPDQGELEPGFDRHWILVTDGMVDISLDEEVNKASRERILYELTTRLEEQGIHLHTISMTGYTDKALLKSLSLKTNASHVEVAAPEDLLDTFERIFTQASPSEELPFDGNRFSVDEAIEELTLVVFHRAGEQPEIITPTGRELPLTNAQGVSIAASSHYTLVTITKPQVGDWQVNNVDLERSSIRIITDLNAQVTKIAPVLFINEPIFSTLGLFENEQQIQDDSVLGLLKVEQSLYKINGESRNLVSQQEMVPVGFSYKSKLSDSLTPGNYELLSHVDGQSFSRQMSQVFTVHPAIDFSAEKVGPDLMAFSAKPVNLKLHLLRSSVRIEYVYQDGTKRIEDMPLIGQGYWQQVVPLEAEKGLRVRLNLQGVTQNGVNFEYWSQPWQQGQDVIAEPITATAQSSDTGVVIAAPKVDVMPIYVPSSVVEVADPNAPVQDENNDLKPEPAQIDTSIEGDQQDIFSANEWMLYGALNLAGLIVIVGGVILYRRAKKKSV